jgi:MYXO-CTERM domain-containing protein
MVTGGGTTTTTVTVQSPPTWLTSEPTSATLDPTSCFGGAGFVTANVAVPLTVTKDAPGVIETPLSLVASVGSSTSDPDSAVVTVAYNWDYKLTTDVTFPVTMTTPTKVFNLTITQASNARSMVMIEEIKASAGLVSGLASVVYENGPGKPDTKVFKITYTAPEGEWTNATVSFKAYGHYLLLDSRSGSFDAGTPMSWTFTNGGVEKTGGGGGKDSPAPVGAFMALGLVALAALVRRRA